MQPHRVLLIHIGNIMTSEITTKDLKVRRFRPSDSESRVEVLNQTSSILGVFIDVPVDVKLTSEWAQRIVGDPSRVDFVLEQSDSVIGFGGLVAIDHKSGNCELYIFLNENASGRGNGQYFLRFLLGYAKIELNIRKVSLYVSSNNQRALGFYKNLGFVQEGLLLKHVWHRGQYVDRHILSLFLNTIVVTPEEVYSYIS